MGRPDEPVPAELELRCARGPGAGSCSRSPGCTPPDPAAAAGRPAAHPGRDHRGRGHRPDPAPLPRRHSVLLREWGEVELEPGTGGGALLDALEQRLSAAGLTRSDTPTWPAHCTAPTRRRAPIRRSPPAPSAPC
ncbi:hypothetical protein GXW82_04755 [Streptacidiphilus sp. 4-A2]|nr:hypothetical protein [Streptacidiphilus sp. 4-A2]